MSRLARGGMSPTSPTMSFLWGYADGFKRGRAASGIETEGHDRAAGRGAEHESPTAESGDAQNIAQDIGGPSQ